MPKVEFKIGNQKFDLVCDEGQQARIRTLAKSVDTRVASLSKGFGSAPDTFILAIATLMMEDEIRSLREQIGGTPEAKMQKNNTEYADLQVKQIEKILEEIILPVSDYIEALAERIENM